MGFGAFGGIDIMYNGLSNSIKSFYKNQLSPMSIDKYFKYINVPISLGVDYRYNVADNIGIMCKAGIVSNYLKVTNMEASMFGITTKVSNKLTSMLGLRLGGGILLNDKISVMLDYYPMTKGIVKSTTESFGYKYEQDLKIDVDILTATIGFWF